MFAGEPYRGGARSNPSKVRLLSGGLWRSSVRRLMGAIAAVAACAVPGLTAPASASAAGFGAPGYAVSPMTLPATGAHAAAGEPGKWLVGARTAISVDKVARRFGAARLKLRGTYVVPRARARGFATALRRRGALAYAEPDITLRRASVPDAAPAGWARGAAGPPPAPRRRRVARGAPPPRRPPPRACRASPSAWSTTTSTRRCPTSACRRASSTAR